jgi:adenosylmethionine-8-amino-7-oxononanoate aminotransferase
MGLTTPDDLKHLVLHFTKGKAWRDATVPVYVRGEGCYLWDENGRRYLDGLAGLFVVQIGHGRSDIAHAAAKQMEDLAYTPSWGAAHPPAIEASKLVTSLAPGDLDAIFWVSSGSEAVESAIKFTRQYHRSQGNPEKTGVISRRLSYHGTTMGALSATGLDSIREQFQPLLPGFIKVDNTLGATDGVAAARQVEDAILQAGPETVGLVMGEPVQNSGGCLVPPDGYWPELRRICDKYDVLLLADEVINSFGRVGHWFAAERYGVVPDMITFAKGATSGYAPVGGLLIRRGRVDELMDSKDGTFAHGATWGAHPVVMAVTIANVTAMRDEGVVDNVLANEDYFRARLDEVAAAHDTVSDVRGTGYFYAIELTASRENGAELTEDQTNELVNDHMPGLIADAGLLIRSDARGAPKLVLSPPLIATTEELDELVAGVDQVLTRAAQIDLR